MGVLRLCFLLFCVFVVSDSSVRNVRKLKGIAELKRTGYGRPYPRHGLQLLFRIVLRSHVDHNNILVSFDPRRGDYGFRKFKNRERVLPRLSYFQSYYEVSNLNSGRLENREVLQYCVRWYENRYAPERSMDRLIVLMDQENLRVCNYQQRDCRARVSRVFVTAHNRGVNTVKPSDTYEITPSLITEIRQKYSGGRISEDRRCVDFLRRTGYFNYS